LIPEKIKFVFLEFIQSFGLGVIQLMLGTHKGFTGNESGRAFELFK
jgi:hypothetical protein